jgi:hypothetical protein
MRRAETFLKRTAPIVLGLLAFCSASVRAQTASRQFAIPSVTVTAPPKIDGTLDDPAWKSAAHVQLQWDISFQRPATEATDAYLLADKHYLYVAFVATQKEPIIATQHTNDQPMPNDDVVRVYFWPGGDSGIEYGFVSNPIGTRYELSSENTSFSPAWVAVAKTTSDGYVVTERIPLNVMRGDGRSTWRVQFDRRVRAANQTFEWAHDPAQSGTDSSLYAGYLQGMTVASQGTRTKPRIGIYALGQYASAASGGSTSRLGADLSVPLTQTSSFVATFHPDYSNVELDQQSISPTAFPRRFNEVRPFFTQGQNYYNSFNCNDCIDYPLLYTPAIPTPRSGFAVEGKQGQLTFGAFDALGISRNDAAQSLYWVSKNRKYQAVYQRVAVDVPGIHDVAEWYQGIVGNAHNFNVYATLGAERGSLITDAPRGRYREYGINLFTPKSGLFAAYHDVGSQYGPLDAFNQISDTHGPTLYAFKEFDNKPSSFIQSVIVSQDVGRMRDGTGALNDAYDSFYVTVATRNQLFFGWSSGDSYLNFGPGFAGEANRNGIQLTYGFNTSTPTTFSYNVGRFGAGFLRSPSLSSTIRLTRRGTLTLQAFKNDQTMDNGSRNIQWLERASIGYQAGPGESYAVGWRRIIGAGPTFFGTAQFVNATNFSFAFYKRTPMAEIYFAYGNPNMLNTQHDVILKLIQYFGAEKGT